MPTLGPESAYIFRITHVNNVRFILSNGIHCRSGRVHDPKFTTIGLPTLIDKRAALPIPIAPGGTLSDYIPFYFTPWSIMLYNIKTGFGGVTHRQNHEVAIVVCSLRKLAAMGVRFVFTNAHAYTAEAEFFDSLDALDQIDWDLLRSKDFRHDPEDPGKKSRYQAEALIHRHVPVEAILGVACYNADVQARLAKESETVGGTTPIKVLPNWYF